MSLTRKLKGKALDIVDRMVPVRPLERSQQEQTLLDRESRRMHLYFTRTCPSSITVRRQCQRLGLKVVEKDVLRVNAYRNELVNGGGVPRIPCLRIDDEQGGRWLYSPETIIDYLKGRY